jgi:hypothetical protein
MRFDFDRERRTRFRRPRDLTQDGVFLTLSASRNWVFLDGFMGFIRGAVATPSARNAEAQPGGGQCSGLRI